MLYNIRPETISIMNVVISRLSFPMLLAVSNFFYSHISGRDIWELISKGVFEQRPSTGGLLFAFFGNGFIHIFERLVSIRVKKPSDANLVPSRCNKISSRALECVVW